MKFNDIDFDTYLKNYPDENGFYGKYGGAYISPELKKAMADREVYLASVRQRQEEYKASKNQAPGAFNAAGGMTYNF